MPHLFKRFLLDFEWFLYCVLLYHKTCYFYICRQELFLMYSCRALEIQWYFTLSRPSSFVRLKLKKFYLSVFCTFISHLGWPIAVPGDVSNVHNVQWQHSWLYQPEMCHLICMLKKIQKEQGVHLAFSGQVCKSNCVYFLTCGVGKA